MAIEDGERKELLEKRKAMAPDIVPLDDENQVPPWLSPLLQAKFFTHCTVHAESNKNECNHYCLDCTGDAFCFFCLQNHRYHRIVQIRRSSYHNVVKVSEISKHIDISGIQTYVINSAKIVFLDERPQARPVKEVTYACQTCCRPLLESHRFCSIGCKLRGMSQDKNVTIAAGGELRRSESNEISKSSKRSLAAMNEEESEGASSSVRCSGNSGECAPPVVRRPRSRRKGIPHRAPFH